MIACVNLTKQYQDLVVLNNININIQEAKSLAITGSSGSGKSTLLNIIAGIDYPNSGKVIINNTNINELNDNELAIFRAKNIGFVFQFHHLLSDFNLLENIAIPLLINGVAKEEAYNKARQLLKKVNLVDKAKCFINELSGGQRQRGAVLRAIITNPKIVLADEPTGNLDVKNASIVLQLLTNLCQDYNTTLIMATHNRQLLKNFDTIYDFD